MRNNFFTLLMILFCCTTIRAQQASPATVNCGGSSKTAAGILLEDAVGGLVVQPVATGTFMYTPDFLQPDAGTTTVIPVINNVTLGSGSGVDNGGNSFSNGNILLEFTVGEVASNTLSQPASILTQGILQPMIAATTLPVTGMEFYARRISPSLVQLDWKTVQEINNRGFYVERSVDGNALFRSTGFVATKAGTGGNSSLPLQYQYTDTNQFTGPSYYRLMQEDMDGRHSFSVIRMVYGATGSFLHLQAWPVPSNGPVTVRITGLTEPDQLLVADQSGRIIRCYPVQQNSTVKVTALPAGMYYIRLAGDKSLVQKIVIQ